MKRFGVFSVNLEAVQQILNNENYKANNRSLIKIVDLFGRETEEKLNISLFYIYDDGTVEKKIIIE